MTDLTTKIRKLERYSKALGEIKFTVSIIGSKTTVKLFKKYNLCTVPDQDSGDILIDNLNAAVINQKTKIDDALALLSEKAEQMTLNLFSKEVPDGTNDGPQPGTSRRDQDCNREHSSGEEST
jgi:hypothetical protein